MNTSKYSVLVTCAGVIHKYKGNWGTASQNTILGLLKTFHDIDIKRRQLGYHLADLRSEELIRTIKRHRRDPDGTICYNSSATCLTIKGCLFLYRKGVVWALKHMKKLRDKYIPHEPTGSKWETAKKPRTPGVNPQGDSPFMDSEFRRKKGFGPIPAHLAPSKA